MRLRIICMALLVDLVVAASVLADGDANTFLIDTVWTLFPAVLIFLIYAGFAILENRFTRAKNAASIMVKNLMDFSIGTLTFWAARFSIMLGAGGGPLIDIGQLLSLRRRDGVFRGESRRSRSGSSK